MGCEIIRDRKVKLNEGQKLLLLYKISGFPFGDGAPDMLMDFIDEGGQRLVRFSKLDSAGRPNGKPKQWGLSELHNSGNGLADFAKSMGIDHQTPGAFLARFIEDKAKQIR